MQNRKFVQKLEGTLETMDMPNRGQTEHLLVLAVWLSYCEGYFQLELEELEEEWNKKLEEMRAND